MVYDWSVISDKMCLMFHNHPCSNQKQDITSVGVVLIPKMIFVSQDELMWKPLC